MPTATQSTSEQQINEINAWMRGQPWYQQWFQLRGLDPNRVKLTEAERTELSQVAAQNGVQLGDRMKIDEAGNVNQKGGFAGMPTWAKVAIGAAPVAATLGFGAAGVGPLSGVFGGAAAPGYAASVGAPAATEAAIFGGAGATGAMGAAGAAGGGVLSKIFNGGTLPYWLTGGANVLGTVLANRGASQASEQQMQAVQQAMDLNRQIYGQQRADQQPFYQTGVDATGTLSHLLGLRRG